MTKKIGRPKGMKKVDQVLTEDTKCKKCGSSERSSYTHTSTQMYPAFRCNRCSFFGVEGDKCPCGGEYTDKFTHITKRRTRCLNCHQSRIDVCLENKSS